MNCILDINKHQNLNSFSFKSSEIKTDTNEIYVPKLDEILLLNEVKKKEDEKMNLAIIIGCVLGGIILIGG